MDNFDDIALDTFTQIESRIEELDHEDVDFEPGDRRLTIEIGETTKYIFSLQSVTHEIWLAAGSQGLHFSYNEETKHWVSDKGGEELFACFGRLLSDRLNEDVSRYFTS